MDNKWIMMDNEWIMNGYCMNMTRPKVTIQIN